MKKLICSGILLTVVSAHAGGITAKSAPASIPWSQIGAKAEADYKGEGLAVTPTESGARLHCVFQRLDGEATPEGLWLSSTVTNSPSDHFRVRATGVGRQTVSATSDFPETESNNSLVDVGTVSADGQTARFSRPAFTEEYSVSMDGVRQDFKQGSVPHNRTFFYTPIKKPPILSILSKIRF